MSSQRTNRSTARRWTAWASCVIVALIVVALFQRGEPAEAQGSNAGGELTASAPDLALDQVPSTPDEAVEPAHGVTDHTPTQATAPGATVDTHHEVVPNPVHGSDFSVDPTCQNVELPCAWNDATTWLRGSIPAAGTRVIIDGHVSIRSEDAVAHSVGVYPGGTLTFDQDTDTALTLADLVVFDGGTLQIGTVDDPISSTARAEVIFRNAPFDESDPTQILRGLVATGGTVSVSGSPLDETYVRTAFEPTAGSTTITTEHSMSAAGWSQGDVVLIPASAQCRAAAGVGCESQTEERTIVALSDNVVTLDSPLTYDHPGARDHTGSIDFMPHLINTTRNVIFRSEDPDGIRGHMLFHGRADVDVRYAELRDMGRTTIENLGSNNQKGRYPLHAHHLIGPAEAQDNGYQFTFVGNSVDFGPGNVDQGHKWGISIHGSHYGLIEANTVDNASGAAIVTESGSEMGNMIRANFVVRVIGGNTERTEDIDPFDGTKSGRAGVGYWFNGGGRNSFRDNIAADVIECVYCFGFKFDNIRSGELLFPTEQGSDPMVDGGERIDGNLIGIGDFANNEAYAVPNGLTVWWACTFGETPFDECSSRLDSFRVWHHHRWGYYGYETNNMTMDGFVVRGDPEVLENQFEIVQGLEFGDYMQRNLVVSNVDIQNMNTGIRLPTFRDVRNATGPDDGWTHVEDGYIVATEGIGVWAPSSVNGSASDLAAQTSVISNVHFDYPTVSPPNVERAHIRLSDLSIVLDPNKTNFDVRNDVVVINYDQAPGNEGEDFVLIPSYHGPSRCDTSIADCDQNLTELYGDVDQAHIFGLGGQ